MVGTTYVRPVLEQIARLDGEGIALALLLFGLAGILGSSIGGMLGQRSAAGGAAASAVFVAVSASALIFLGNGAAMAFVSVTLWALALGSFPVCISTWNAEAAPEHAESAGALMATSFQIAIAMGASTGGSVFDNFGAHGVMSITSVAVLAGALVMLLFGLPLERKRKLAAPF